MRSRPALLVLLILAGGACGEKPVDAPPASGIFGQTLAGPQCPVEMAGTPCPDRPISAEVIAEPVGDTAGEITPFESDDEGHYRVRLAPGIWSLTPTIAEGGLLAPPLRVTVPEGEFIKVDIRFDTGIR